MNEIFVLSPLSVFVWPASSRPYVPGVVSRLIPAKANHVFVAES
jgi:hypothetical protein